MKRLSARLPSASATFLFSLLLTNALTVTKPAPAQHEQPTPQATPFVSPTVAPPQPSPTPDKTPRISQQEIVNFPGIGKVRISTFDASAESMRLEFRDASTEKMLDREYVGDYEPGPLPDMNPYLRFKVMHIKGLPDPLIVGVSMAPGVSDSSWQSVAVSAVGGELRELTTERLETSNQGGFYYGDLGSGRGFGALSWDSVWSGGDECHYCAHRFELKVYKWSEKTKHFEWYEVLRTHGKFEDGEKAVRSLGFNLSDMRRSFPDFKDFFE
jgi:hypothetical protein